MAEQVSRIIIKSSTGSETPASGDLYRGELGYSYKSDRLFIGNETNDSNYVIGGRAFFELFNDIVDGNGNAQHGIVYPHNVIIAGPNKDLDELDVKLLKVDGQVLTSSASTLNLFSSIDSLETDNALPNVTHTQIATSKAIKEYVDEKTDLISDFINSTPLPGQLLVGNDQNKFEYVDVTGVIQFSSTGLTSYTPSSVTNDIIENPTIQIGLQVAELGTIVVPNLNVDTSGVLNVNRGGSGKTELNKNEILIGDYTSPIASSNNFTYDVANNVFTANANSYIKNVEIENNLQVNQDAVIVGELTVNGVSVFNQSPSFTGDITFPENLTVEKNAYVIGDLYVSGNTVSVEAQRVLVEDNIIVLGANNTTDLVDLGFVGQYDGNRYAGIVRSALDDKFYVLEDYFPEPENTLHNFDSNTMYGVIRGIFEATDISIETGTATDLVINDSDLTNVDITFSTADELVIDNATANNLTIVRSDITNLFANTSYIDSLTIYDDLTLATSATLTLSGTIIFDNANIDVLNNSNFNIDGILNLNRVFADVVDSNSITGDVYSGIYLDMIENVNGNATVGQLLTADGLGNYYFSNTVAGYLVDLLDLQPNLAYQSNTILTAFGNGEFYFSNTVSVDELISIDNTLENVTANNVTITTLVSTENTLENISANNISANSISSLEYAGIYLDMLENVNATSTIDQVLTSDGTGGFYFANNIHTTTFASLVDVNSTASNNQVLTADGLGNFYFADAGTELKLLTDVNSTASNNQVLTADGLGNFYFTDVTFELKELIDVYSNSNANEILTAYSNGVYYFSDTLTNVHIDSSSANNLTIDNIVVNSGQVDNVDLTNINILSGLANNLTITNSTLTNVNVTGGNSDNYTSNNATINSSEINNSTINNPIINNGTANNLTLTNTTLNSNTTLNGYVTINNTLEVANDLHVDGDLFVNGNTITLDAQTLTVEDNIVVLGSNNVSDITDLGFAFKYNNGVSDEYAGFFRDATDEKFYLFKEFTIDPPVTTMTGFNSSTMLATLFGNFEANNLIASSGSLENMIANNITMTYSTIENSVIDCGTF